MRWLILSVALVAAACSSSNETTSTPGAGGRSGSGVVASSTSTSGNNKTDATSSAGIGGAIGDGGGVGVGGSTQGSGGSTIAYAPDPCIAANTCPPGKWIDVTPVALSLDPNYSCTGCNYGASDVVADPVRPNEVYAFICYQGVWKSTDYGLTWAKVSTGQNSDHIESGRPATAAIDPNRNRDPNTPPALYTVSLYGDQLGVYKSVDGGVDWNHYSLGNTQGVLSDDAYALDIDPNDSEHLISGFHDVGLSESMDGGQTWKTVPVPANFGISVYPQFVVGLGAMTSSTWITIAQWNNNTNGMWRTVDSGMDWTQVNPSLEHGHGSGEIYQDGKGHIYAAGNSPVNGPLQRSADYGVTWAGVDSNQVPQNGVFGTPDTIYATFPGALLEGVAQHLQQSPGSDGVHWSDSDPIAPEGMTNGAKRAAVTYDGSHYVIVTRNFLAGIWRYVE